MGISAYVYLIVSLFSAAFGAVYEHFSHGVYSNYMIYAFVFPFAGGTLPLLSLVLSGCRRLPNRLSLSLYHSGIAALTVGSIIKGALEIYGITNRLVFVYWAVGGGLAGLGIIFYLLRPPN